ncbi:MAG: hypothetical protein K6F53_08395 [Lachnospiraceae bacterium]|nr:hypothetical protein [Lachnospiraceae bacterium]
MPPLNLQQRREKTLSGELQGTSLKDQRAQDYYRRTFDPTRIESRDRYEARLRPDLLRMGLNDREADLYLRRHTAATVTITRAGMMTLKQDVATIPADLQRDEEQEMVGKSRRERKAIKERHKTEGQDSYNAAMEQVTTEFADEQSVLTTWGKKEVLDKKTKIPHEDGTEEEVTQEELLGKVLLQDDCSNLEQLDPVLRNLAAKKYMEGFQFNGNITSPEDFVNALFKNGGVSALMHPLFRIGISILAKGGTVNGGVFQSLPTQFFSAIEDLCNQRIMSSTMYTLPDETVTTQGERLQNQISQRFMMKTLFMAHLGGLKKYTKGQPGTWDDSMASAFAHCSRVAFTLPKAADGGGRDMDTRGFKKRTAATHRLHRKRVDGSSDLIEKKMPLGWYWNQHGMNVAVGGLGNPGVPGVNGQMRRIKNDGSGGHIYMHVDKGDETSYTGLLIGFESDAPGVQNQTGHKHGTGNPEFMSSFGGLRTDEIGDKYGGRVVDCSGLDPAAFDLIMQKFERKIETLQDAVRSPESPYLDHARVQQGSMDELMNICDLLSGKQMTAEQIMQVAGLTQEEYRALQRTA